VNWVACSQPISFFRIKKRVPNDVTFKFLTEEQPAMAEAADAEAMRKQMAEMKKELEMMR